MGYTPVRPFLAEGAESLGEAFPREIARCTRLLGEYRALGPAGDFGAAMIQQTIDDACQALATSDTIAMIEIYPRLTAHEWHARPPRKDQPMIHARRDYDRIQDPDSLIPADEPVMLIRGQDIAALPALDAYMDAAIAVGADKDLIDSLHRHRHRIADWQDDVRVHVPLVDKAQLR